MPIADAPPAILATAVVPWTERYEFDEPRFKRQVHTIARTLTKHIYIFGKGGGGARRQRAAIRSDYESLLGKRARSRGVADGGTHFALAADDHRPDRARA